MTATENGVSGTTTLTVTQAALVSITVSAAGNNSLAPGATAQFTATGILADNSTEDLTNLVTWSSSSTGVATISAAGLASAVSAGSATIGATFNGITGTAAISVAAPVPLVQVVKIVPVLNKKHQVIKIEVFFSGLVNSIEAANTLTYVLKTPGKKNSFTAKNAKSIKLKSALYTAAKNEVDITPKAAFALSKPVQLTIEGSLQDELGRFIDGNNDGQAGATGSS